MKLYIHYMQLTNGINSKLKCGFIDCLPFLFTGLWVCSINICFVHSWTYFVLKIYQLLWWQYYVFCIASLNTFKNCIYFIVHKFTGHIQVLREVVCEVQIVFYLGLYISLLWYFSSHQFLCTVQKLKINIKKSN